MASKASQTAAKTLIRRGTGRAASTAVKPRVKSWVPEDDVVLMDTTRQALIYNLGKVQNAVAEGLVPWFTANMPVSYFRQVNSAMQLSHMRSLSAQFDPQAKDFIRAGRSRVVLQSLTPEGDLEMTYMDFSGNKTGLLASQLEDISAAGQPIGNLSRVKVFTSLDGKLAFNIFTFESAAKPKPSAGGALPAYAQHVAQYAGKLEAAHAAGAPPADPGIAWSPLFEEASLAKYVTQNCPPAYVEYTGPRSFLQQRLLFAKVAGTEDVAVHFEHSDINVSPGGLMGSGTKRTAEGAAGWIGADAQHVVDGGYWLKVALSNSVPIAALKKILLLFKHRDIDVQRMHLDVLECDRAPRGGPTPDTVTMVRMLIMPPAGAAGEEWLHTLQREIKRTKWADDSTLALAFETLSGPPSGSTAAGRQEVGIERAEVITCLATMLHALLPKQDAWAFSKTNVNAAVRHPRYLRHAAGIADLFAARFDPDHPLPDARYRAWRQALRDEIELDVQEDSVAKEVLHRMLSTVDATLRTNLYLEDRYALSLRLSSHLFVPGAYAQPFASGDDERVRRDVAVGTDTPYGVFYVHGRRFNGFHVRFRDIARGGMRLVTPATVEQLAIESARQYDECYGLASAQQMKNKDIPEGGSKCVVLVDTCGVKASEEKALVLRKSVKAFTDALLDLIVATPETASRVVDLYGKQELVYLGPDEQVIPEDINWIVGRAAQRGYPIPSAFMSSKPDAGINHKTYGVTSEGVQVYLDVALREMGMHPEQRAAAGEKQPYFTVKMTGGPDGDVAGNMIKILNREYGANVKIVGLADATGSAEDPAGLDMGELLRLFEEGLPIAKFSASKLSGEPGAALHVCDPHHHAGNAAAAEAALRARNTMHNRVVSDAFIPAGGRPNTIHEGNWRQFLRPDNGQPSSKLIVEGANLFLTAGARRELHAATGIPIVKDSSANKCGVICSSFEIMSSMLLSEPEFLAVKPALVKDVVVRLRALAAREAELLFREFRSLPGSLPDFSARISLAINRLTDAVADSLDEQTGGDYSSLMYLVEGHLPETLNQVAGARVATRVPPEYVKRTIASVLACKVVYQEGVTFVEQHTDAHLAPLAFDYLKAETEVRGVLRALDGLEWGADAAAGAAARQIVKDGGIRSYLSRNGGFAK
jgi:glutamate dehydrogenase